MSKVIAVCGRDLKAWLNTFSFYVLAVLFLGVTGYFFWSGLSYFSLVSFHVATNPAFEAQGLNLTEGVSSVFLANVVTLMLLLIPILTMRSFSEEKRNGTLELLCTYPVSDFQIAFGKFLSLLFAVMLLVLPTALYFFLGPVVGARFEVSSLLTGYLGLFLVGASLAALGMFTSSLTEHQAISAGIAFVTILFFWIIGWMADWTSPALGTIFRELSFVEHFKDLPRGIIDTKDIAFFLLFTAFFFFATLSVLEIRTWKK